MSLTILEERLLDSIWQKAQGSLSKIVQGADPTLQVYNLYIESISFRGYNSKNTEFSDIFTPNQVKIWAILKNEDGHAVNENILKIVNRGLARYESEFLRYWQELYNKFKLSLDFATITISGPIQGIECFLLGGKETKSLMIKQNLGSGKFPDSYEKLRSQVMVSLELNYENTINLLREYAPVLDGQGGVEGLRFEKIKKLCHENYEKLVQQLKVKQDEIIKRKQLKQKEREIK